MSAPKSELKTLITSEEIHKKVHEMGKKISEDYAGKELKIIGTLKGCFIFMADLVRQIDVPVTVDFIEASSYGDDVKSSGIVKINKDFKHSILGEHVILIEDIIDTGITLNFLVENIQVRKPASLRIASLLVKENKQQMKYPIDYRGFNIEDYFVVGYGMDFRGYYRNLDYVAIMNDDPQLKLFDGGS